VIERTFACRFFQKTIAVVVVSRRGRKSKRWIRPVAPKGTCMDEAPRPRQLHAPAPPPAAVRSDEAALYLYSTYAGRLRTRQQVPMLQWFRVSTRLIHFMVRIGLI
jgi:hypothetical protein